MNVFAPDTVVSVIGLVLLLQSHRTTSQPPRSTTRLPGRSTTSRPTSSTTIQPTSSATSQPTSSLLSQPTSPTTSRLTSSTTSRPTSSKTSQSTSPTTSQPTSSETNQPTSSATSQPTSSKTSQSTSPTTSQPTSSKTSQSTSSKTSQSTSLTTSQPASSTATRPANSTTPGPINPCQDCFNSVANLTAVIDQMASRLERHEQFLAETTRTIIGNISSQLDRQERVFEETIRATVGNISSQLEKQALALELVGSAVQPRNESQSQSLQTLLLANITTLLRKQGDDLNQLRMLVDDLNVQQTNLSQVLQTMEDCGKNESELDKLQRRLIEEIHDVLLAPTDCMDIKATGKTVNGVYSVIVGQEARRREVNVSCDMRTSCGGWLVFQRRNDGSLNFQRKWSEYASGFGDVNGEFWLGNDILHLLTSKRKYMLRIDLESFKGEKRFAQYSRFSVASSLDYYRLTVAGYSGNAEDSLSLQNGQQFSTEDVDRDKWTTGNCAKRYGGAWWYSDCHSSTLNGKYLDGDHESYADGKVWYNWKGFPYSLKATEMKIAPLD